MAEKEQQAIDKHSFYVKANAEYAAKKLASLYTGPSTGGTGKTKKLDFSEMPSNSLAELGLVKEDISEAYAVNALHRKDFASELIMALSGPLAGSKAVVIEYKSKPGISEIIPTHLENSLVCKKNIKKLGLELI